MGVQSFVLIPLFFFFFLCCIGARETSILLFAHFAKIAIKHKCVIRLPRSLAQMKNA